MAPNASCVPTAKKSTLKKNDEFNPSLDPEVDDGIVDENRSRPQLSHKETLFD